MKDTFSCHFQVLGDFSLYDYNKPLVVPEKLKGAFEVVVADPPYLVCQEVESRATGLHPLNDLLQKPCTRALAPTGRCRPRGERGSGRTRGALASRNAPRLTRVQRAAALPIIQSCISVVTDQPAISQHCA